MLPEGFKGQSIYGLGGAVDANAFAYLMRQVARLDEKIGGGWIASLYYPDGRRVTRDCTTYAAGRAGIEAWADRNQAVLIAEAERHHAEWAAKQAWRGRPLTSDSMPA